MARLWRGEADRRVEELVRALDRGEVLTAVAVRDRFALRSLPSAYAWISRARAARRERAEAQLAAVGRAAQLAASCARARVVAHNMEAAPDVH